MKVQLNAEDWRKILYALTSRLQTTTTIEAQSIRLLIDRLPKSADDAPFTLLDKNETTTSESFGIIDCQCGNQVLISPTNSICIKCGMRHEIILKESL